jgi:hypothetical protein
MGKAHGVVKNCENIVGRSVFASSCFWPSLFFVFVFGAVQTQTAL